MSVKEDMARYRANLQGEVDGAAMCRAMADLEPQPERAEVYRCLAAVEESQASFWRKRLEGLGAPQPEAHPGWRTKLLILGGSAWAAAASSFLIFMVGAIVPVIPFFLLSGNAAVIASLAVSGLALCAIGALTSIFTAAACCSRACACANSPSGSPRPPLRSFWSVSLYRWPRRGSRSGG